MKPDYGLFLPSAVYEKLAEFLKNRPKKFQKLLGGLIGIPLFLFDILLGLTAPLFALLLCGQLSPLIYTFFSSRLIAVAFLFQFAMMGLNRYLQWRNRRQIAVFWLGYLTMINISFVFFAHNNLLMFLQGVAFIAANIANAIISVYLIGNPNRTVLQYLRILTELALLASVYGL